MEVWPRGEPSCWALTAGPVPQLFAEAYIPPQVFYNGKVDYFHLQRLGGLLSHLRKTLKGAFWPLGSEQVRAGWRQGAEPTVVSAVLSFAHQRAPKY